MFCHWQTDGRAIGRAIALPSRRGAVPPRRDALRVDGIAACRSRSCRALTRRPPASRHFPATAGQIRCQARGDQRPMLRIAVSSPAGRPPPRRDTAGACRRRPARRSWWQWHASSHPRTAGTTGSQARRASGRSGAGYSSIQASSQERRKRYWPWPPLIRTARSWPRWAARRRTGSETWVSRAASLRVSQGLPRAAARGAAGGRWSGPVGRGRGRERAWRGQPFDERDFGAWRRPLVAASGRSGKRALTDGAGAPGGAGGRSRGAGRGPALERGDRRRVDADAAGELALGQAGEMPVEPEPLDLNRRWREWRSQHLSHNTRHWLGLSRPGAATRKANLRLVTGVCQRQRTKTRQCPVRYWTNPMKYR